MSRSRRRSRSGPGSGGRGGVQSPNDVGDPEVFAERAIQFVKVVIDSSSIIVLEDIGLLNAAHRLWHLVTIPAVAEECGDSAAGVELFPWDDRGPDGAPLSADKSLVELAARNRLPLFSEDRKVLSEAEERRLDCFDCLVAVELLSAFHAITPLECASARAGLGERNNYRADRLRWAAAVGAAAMKLR